MGHITLLDASREDCFICNYIPRLDLLQALRNSEHPGNVPIGPSRLFLNLRPAGKRRRFAQPVAYVREQPHMKPRAAARTILDAESAFEL